MSSATRSGRPSGSARVPNARSRTRGASDRGVPRAGGGAQRQRSACSFSARVSQSFPPPLRARQPSLCVALQIVKVNRHDVIDVKRLHTTHGVAVGDLREETLIQTATPGSIILPAVWVLSPHSPVRPRSSAHRQSTGEGGGANDRPQPHQPFLRYPGGGCDSLCSRIWRKPSAEVGVAGAASADDEAPA